MKSLLFCSLICFAAVAVADDWPQWGRDNSRNMVSPTKGLPDTFDPGKPKPDGSDPDPATTKNIKWVARLGSQAYGNATVAAGRVFVGTNNDPGRDPRIKGDRGIVLCLDEATGKFLWQLAVPKLAAGGVADFEGVGICSSPTIDGDRVYFVTNRCEVICLDAKGLANGNDGPFKDEAEYLAGPGKPPDALAPTDADIIWRIDMRDELGVFPHNMTSSAVLIVGDRLYATTSNGRDWTNKHLPAPDAPAIICLDKRTGKLLGQEHSGISRNTFNCNWSSPTYANINGKELIIFGGGDGFCYAFDPVPTKDADGLDILREIWRYDCNPDSHKSQNGKPLKHESSKGPSEIIATPVVYKNRVYVAVGQNPEQGDGIGCLNCIDATKTGDITHSGKIWSFEKIGRALSTASVADGLVYVADFAGNVFCLDSETGTHVWTHDTEGRIWGSTLVADGKVYVGNETGDLTVLAAAREKKLINKITFDGPIYSTPIVANSVMYISTDKRLYAIGK
jgi:outer membrane protein assembly factor BamB